jgi:hypothetical protein
MANSTTASSEFKNRGFTKEMWVVLVLFAFLILSNTIFILDLILVGEALLVPILLDMLSVTSPFLFS